MTDGVFGGGRKDGWKGVQHTQLGGENMGHHV